MRKMGLMALACLVLSGGPAFAGGGNADGTRVEGQITAVDVDLLQIIVADTTVQATDQTVIKQKGQVLSFADLAVGQTVAACGLLEDGVLAAWRITVKQCLADCPMAPGGAMRRYGQAKAASDPARQQVGEGAAVQVMDQAAVKAGNNVVPLSAEEQAGLVFMREEEKLARDVYLTLGAQWALPIFSNIAQSEQTHMNSVLTLLVRYGLADPVAGLGVGEFASPEFQALYAELIATGSESVEDALAAGAVIEEIDIVDLFARLAETTHADIRRVYQNLERGSENHLRAFVGQLAARGVVYVPQYLDPEVYADIIGG